MARAMLAGALQGAGQAFASSSTTQSVSALGTTNTISPSQVGRAALGQGLSAAASDASKVFLDLVKQSAPVVEHGPDTDCTVVLTEGTWLEVKDYDDTH
jgi:conjugal transfer pilus assembly protein TraB